MHNNLLFCPKKAEQEKKPQTLSTHQQNKNNYLITFILQLHEHASFSLDNPNVISPKHLRSLNVIAFCLMAL